MTIVCFALKPSLRAASCWSVDVVNGAAGFRRTSFDRDVRDAVIRALQSLYNIVRVGRRS